MSSLRWRTVTKLRQHVNRRWSVIAAAVAAVGGGVEMLCRIWWGGDERGMVMDGDDEAVVGRLGTWRSSKVVA
ncbi:hypothetical protein Tco_0940914 [Tanacetum coccineum]|uniref:Uncharacterized protein n=1 Tax=Tanacetum coccineum TaxID=301880 RepID=A0ABQ5DW03_9ASTR